MNHAPDFDWNSWPEIARARLEAARKRELIETALAEQLAPYSSSDASFVIFGSLAREEWTEHSDVDWLLLIDGQADPQHSEIARHYRNLLESLGLKSPGPTGMFGNLEFSHGLIHQIGGEEDTNSNITRRVCLLLEAIAIGRSDALDRTVHGIIDRYVDDVLVTTHLKQNAPRVPRFLLNDIMRFWRTMAVDYANKKRARNARGWALRNFKLRMSRKLIFASGLVACFSCGLGLAEEWKTKSQDDDLRTAMRQHLLGYVQRTPLDIITRAAGEADASLQRKLLDAYDRFLKLVNLRETREMLEALGLDAAMKNPKWIEVNEICLAFEDALIDLFFDTERFRPLTRRYGIF